jgi:hypothetical protein
MAELSASAIVVALLSVAFLVVVGLGVNDAARRASQLGAKRAEAVATRSDPASTAGGAAAAFRSFGSVLEPGARFALVYDEDYDRNERGFYNLFARYYLYPALAVSDPARADAVMVFGDPLPQVLERFDQLAVVDGFWLGRRKQA